MNKPWYTSVTIIASLFGAISLWAQSVGIVPDGTADQINTAGQHAMALVNSLNGLLIAFGIRRAIK